MGKISALPVVLLWCHWLTFFLGGERRASLPCCGVQSSLWCGLVPGWPMRCLVTVLQDAGSFDLLPLRLKISRQSSEAVFLNMVTCRECEQSWGQGTRPIDVDGVLLAAASPHPDAHLGAEGCRTHFRHMSWQCSLRGSWRSGHIGDKWLDCPTTCHITVLLSSLLIESWAGLVFLTFLFLERRNVFQRAFLEGRYPGKQ